MFLNDSFTFAKKVKQANNLFKANFYSNITWCIVHLHVGPLGLRQRRFFARVLYRAFYRVLDE